MKQKLQTILDSDLLESYLMGTTSDEETLRAENYIARYPEVRKAYDELQENLETFARLHAIEAPGELKDKIVNRIRKENKIGSRFTKFAIAASFAILVSAGASYFFWNQNQSLQKDNTIVSNKVDDLQEAMREQLEDVRNQFIVLQNPETKQYKFMGNKKAQELKAVAYVNPVKKLSYLNVSKLPHLPENQCYQMWAEVNGEMVNLGIIKEADQRLMALPYSDNAVGYITIEAKGGNDRPTVENIVANIAY
ncbi:Anti-sigma-K factor rskA [Pricia antarctica]|uniref:Anti-sigma-K factor rskA n=1 Tax=Pricia antarctica TaxID=641691 RepID=A0A1G7GHT8_9FLAO|nr:anti-sigma factor [Pricia antarctica]SDE87697.1 Anti-sigma-K factor rskA [Pricia antarctica]